MTCSASRGAMDCEQRPAAFHMRSVSRCGVHVGLVTTRRRARPRKRARGEYNTHITACDAHLLVLSAAVRGGLGQHLCANIGARIQGEFVVYTITNEAYLLMTCLALQGDQQRSGARIPQRRGADQRSRYEAPWTLS